MDVAVTVSQLLAVAGLGGDPVAAFRCRASCRLCEDRKVMGKDASVPSGTTTWDTAWVS